MKFTIPEEFMGVTSEEALKIVESNKQQNVVQTASQPINVNSNINRADYIQIAGTNSIIGKKEIFKGKNWHNTHYALAESGFYMPSPYIFMTHFINVKNAAEGKTFLQDANENPISQSEANELWQYLSSTDRTNRGTCWTWLDALFKKDANEKMYMETEHKAVKDASGKWQLHGNRVSLDSYLEISGSLADLSFNRQGLANKASSQNNYIQGENIYFWQPVENTVAGFDANSDWAYLDCYWGPSGAGPSLGVFACAEGAGAKK